MKKHVVFAVACLFIVIFNCGCLESGEGKVITMTMEEIINDYEYNVDNDTKKFTGWYKSLNESDTLIISDTINNITYIESYDYTTVEFESALGEGFPIEGDITDRFGIGDSVELELHIIEVIFTQQMNNETWTIELETFEEGRDSENNTFIPLPQNVISHA